MIPNYVLVESDDTDFLSVMITSGDYVGLVYHYDIVDLSDMPKLKYNYQIDSGQNLVTNEQHFFNMAGDILLKVLSEIKINK